MLATVSVEEAASNFAELLARVTAGEEVVIASGGKPVARLSPVEKGLPRQRIPDLDKGKIWVAPDFDDPLPEFEKEFYGE
jgi:prevent-host-death family protein